MLSSLKYSSWNEMTPWCQKWGIQRADKVNTLFSSLGRRCITQVIGIANSARLTVNVKLGVFLWTLGPGKKQFLLLSFYWKWKWLVPIFWIHNISGIKMSNIASAPNNFIKLGRTSKSHLIRAAEAIPLMLLTFRLFLLGLKDFPIYCIN